MKLLILTASKETLSWGSLPTKLASLKQTLGFDVSIQYAPAIPVVKDHRISHAWLAELIKPFFNQGYDLVGFHFNKRQRNAWGIEPSLRGANPKDNEEQESFYFWADEDSKRLDYDQFTQVALHEIAHAYFQETKLPDETHIYHAAHPDISGLFKKLDWNLYQPKRMALKKEKNRLEAIVRSLVAILAKKPVTGTKPQVKDLLPLVKRQADKFVQEMEMMGLPIRITEGYRSIERQNELYAQGRTTKGNIVTKAKGGESLHNYGVAIDIVFRKQGYDASNDQWLAAATIAERLGFEWGGTWNDFVDKPHFQIMKGYKLKDFQNNLVDYNKYK